MTPRTRDEWPEGWQLYAALAAEAARRGMDVVEIPNRYSGRRRSTPGRWRVELGRVPWNLFDVGLLVEAENTVKHAADALARRKIVVVDMDASDLGSTAWLMRMRTPEHLLLATCSPSAIRTSRSLRTPMRRALHGTMRGRGGVTVLKPPLARPAA